MDYCQFSEGRLNFFIILILTKNKIKLKYFFLILIDHLKNILKYIAKLSIFTKNLPKLEKKKLSLKHQPL